jgi:hypothetical protein
LKQKKVGKEKFKAFQNAGQKLRHSPQAAELISAEPRLKHHRPLAAARLVLHLNFERPSGLRFGNLFLTVKMAG